MHFSEGCFFLREACCSFKSQRLSLYKEMLDFYKIQLCFIPEIIFINLYISTNTNIPHKTLLPFLSISQMLIPGDLLWKKIVDIFKSVCFLLYFN